ncbi:MAG: anaerobic sulfatase maturase [Armatimonadota bacterium]
MVKPVGPACNLRCAYCYYLPKHTLFPNGINCMSDELLAIFTEQYLKQDSQTVTFGWQGGEPTLAGIHFFARALELQRRYRPEHITIENTLQTNGILIDEEWAQFLAENRFLVGLSIDGPKELHDVFRRDSAGKPSWHRVMAAFEKLTGAGAQVNALVVVNSANAKHPLKVYRFLRDAGFRHIQFIPCVEKLTNGQVSQRSVSPDEWGRFLTAIFNEWLERDVGRVFVQIFEEALGMRMGFPPALCVFARTCGRALVLEHNGDLFSCDHFVTPEHRLGNIAQTPLDDIVESDQQHRFGEAKYLLLPQQCLKCEVFFWCRGECPRNRFIPTADNPPGRRLNYLCRGYRSFFLHAGPALQAMADRMLRGMSPTKAAQLSKYALPPNASFAGRGRSHRLQ